MGQEAPQMGWATLQVDRKALPEAGCGQDVLLVGREWSEGSPSCTVVVRRPSQRPGVVKRHSRRAGSSQKALLVGQKAHLVDRE